LRIKSVLLAFLLILSLGLLAGCESSEQRAEKHFQSALTLLEKGDEDRAIIEFRNVFKLNVKHKAARRAFAKLQRKRGNVRGAIGQYLRLVEQYPDDFQAQRAIAEMYAEIGNWPEMKRFLASAQNLDAQDPVLQALQVVFDYRQQLKDKDAPAVRASVEKAVAMIADMPDYILLRQVVIDNEIRSSDFLAARKALDEAIKIAPENRSLWAVRLSVLAVLEDPKAIEAQLIDMIDRFPDDADSRKMLVRWYVSQNQLDDAENYLRQAVKQGQGQVEDQLTLLRFLAELRGRDVAIAELDRLIGAGDAPLLLHGLRAGFEFDAGNRDKAINQLRDLLKTVEPTDESRKIKIALSQMLAVSGDQTAARALVDEVLTEDASNVDALKIKANWLIEDDQVGDAIVALRNALDQAPRDPEIMTLLARAHERNGNSDLVGEMLALAVDAANNAPGETLRYASYLIKQQKYSTAEAILVDALRIAPGNLDLLVELSNVYIGMEDWPRATRARETMQRVGTPEALAVADEIQNRILEAQAKTDETIAFLEGLIAKGSAGFGAKVAIVRNYLTDGETKKAKNYIATLLAEDPENPAVQFMDAAVDSATGDQESAEKKYRAILAKNPRQTQVWIALFRLLSATGQTDAAATAINQALAQIPDDPVLKWAQAGLYEATGKPEDAIKIYEAMYAQDSENLIIANNLASLLSSTRDDAESLDRADRIARRLRISDVPAYQDTYGWIAFLRGQTDEAIKALEPAAAGLTTDPMVQFHLARAYAAANRSEDAMQVYLKVIGLTGPADTRDFVETSRKEISRLRSEAQKSEPQKSDGG
jgi:tetratricopeptide (TPR) repeat protein